MKKSELKSKISALNTELLNKDSVIHKLKNRNADLENNEKFMLREFRDFTKQISKLHQALSSVKRRYTKLVKIKHDLISQRANLRHRLAKELWKNIKN